MIRVSNKEHAHAQAKPEVAVGYSWLRDISEGSAMVIPKGFLVSVAGGPTNWFSVVGEVGGSYLTDGDTLSVYTFQAGPRFSARATPKTTAFGQVLAGTAVARCCGESSRIFLVEPGAGVDFRIGQGRAVRLGVGVPTSFDSGAHAALRLNVGFVFGGRN